MKWLYPVVGLTALVSATPSAAQTQTASQSGQVVSQWYAGGSTGIAAVEKVGAVPEDVARELASRPRR